MITLLTGKKGSGKTKKLIEMANAALEKTNGNVVVVEKGLKLTYDISHAARLIDIDAYDVKGWQGPVWLPGRHLRWQLRCHRHSGGFHPEDYRHRRRGDGPAGKRPEEAGEGIRRQLRALRFRCRRGDSRVREGVCGEISPNGMQAGEGGFWAAFPFCGCFSPKSPPGF